MSYLQKLKDAEDLTDLGNIIGYKAKAISYIAYHVADDKKYKVFTIPKKNGDERIIKAPEPQLRELQERLAHLLTQCYEELYTDAGKSKKRKSLSHGFRKKHSPITNAANHKNKRYVFNIDLKDFFPSLNFGRVRGFFINSKDFSLEPKIATAIAQVACHEDELPQGSPMSPVISNLIGHILDIRLVKLAKKAGCSYSRYADDISFSTREKKFPLLLASKDADGHWVPSDKLKEIIEERSGFIINPTKVSMQYKLDRQMATGLVVNKKVNIPAPYYWQARAMCDALFRKGEFYLGKEMRWGNDKDTPSKSMGSVEQLRGVLSYIYQVKKPHDERDIKEKWKNPTAIHNLYRRFLYFDKFYALQKPLIMCEGKTDNVYLRYAMKSLWMVPDLGFLEEVDEKKVLTVDFFNYSPTNMDLMQFSGGTGDLQSFIHHYKDRMKPFLCAGMNLPVIILLDNDSGANAIKNKVGGLLKRSVDGSEDFYYLGKNLYLVLLPQKVPGEDIMIEHFFEPKVLAEDLDGKTFEPDEKKFDRTKHYGKQVFAEKIIKPKWQNIKFDDFIPILTRIKRAINDYTVYKIR